MLLYAHFLHIIGPLFFPNEDPKVTTLFALLSYASTYLFKPLGGIVFGHLGDTRGRKFVLGASILLMSFPSFLIGCLPTYSSIGIWAPALLLFFRILQSFSEGGETPGAAIFLVESSKLNQRGFSSSFVNVAIFSGGILGSALGYISVSGYFPQWGWRIPFWAGAVIGLVGFYFRIKAVESPLFERAVSMKKIKHIPLLEAFKNHKKSMVCAFGLSAGVCSVFNFTIAYIPFVSQNAFALTTGQVLLMTSFFMLISIIFLLIHGKLADKFGIRKLMSLGCVVCALIIPCVLYKIDQQCFLNLFLLQTLNCFFACALIAPLNAFSVSLFPTNVNFSGNALSWGLGGAIFGGMTPLICHLMKDWTGSFWGPSVYVIFSQLLALTAIFFAPNILQNKPNKLKTKTSKPLVFGK